jgi:hypothetical protein
MDPFITRSDIESHVHRGICAISLRPSPSLSTWNHREWLEESKLFPFVDNLSRFSKSSRSQSFLAAVKEATAAPDGVYRVEKVIDVRVRPDGTRAYLLKWAGYSDLANTWEAEWDIDPEMIRDFEDTRVAAASTAARAGPGTSSEASNKTPSKRGRTEKNVDDDDDGSDSADGDANDEGDDAGDETAKADHAEDGNEGMAAKAGADEPEEATTAGAGDMPPGGSQEENEPHATEERGEDADAQHNPTLSSIEVSGKEASHPPFDEVHTGFVDGLPVDTMMME